MQRICIPRDYLGARDAPLAGPAELVRLWPDQFYAIMAYFICKFAFGRTNFHFGRTNFRFGRTNKKLLPPGLFRRMILSQKVFRNVKISNITQFTLYYNVIYRFRRMKIYGIEIRSVSLEGCIIS